MNEMTTPKSWKDKKRYSAITEEDLIYNGDVDGLIDRIWQRIGNSRSEIKRLILKRF